MGLHAAAASLLELCVLAGLCLSLWLKEGTQGLPRGDSRQTAGGQAERQRAAEKGREELGEEERATEMMPDEAMLHRAKQGVQSGELRPTVASIKASFSVGQRVATEIRDHLLKEGVILKSGRSYSLAGGAQA